jgi:hypothetical protein
MVGLGFLRGPSRPTVLWTGVFVVAMASAYGSIAAADLDSVPLWLLSMGIMLPTPLLIWSGLRAQRGARVTFAWLAVVGGAVATTVLLVGFGSPGFHILARSVVLLSTLANVLVLMELLRRPTGGRGTSLPLVVVSGAWILLGVVGFIASLLNITKNYALLTQSNSVAILVYLICVLVSLLLIVRETPGGGAGTSRSSFHLHVAERLARAQVGGEHTWTLLDIRLDDAHELRAAAGETGFTRLTERFQTIVRGAFPAEADIDATDPGRALVLIARTPAKIRACLRSLLEELATIDADAPLSVQLSASVGWADVDSAGYELDALLSAAEEDAISAMASGGEHRSLN